MMPPTLAEMIRADGPFSADEAALIGVQLCRRFVQPSTSGAPVFALDPERVVREPDGQVRCLDPDPSTAGSKPTLQDLGHLLFFLVSGSFPAPTSRLRDIRPDLPERFIHVVDRALGRDASRAISAANSIELELLQAMGRSESAAPPSTTPGQWVVGVAAVAAVAIGAYGVVLRPQEPAPLNPERFLVPVPGHLTIPHGPGSRVFAVSPDGSQLVFSVMDAGHNVARLFVKRADAFDVEQIAPRGGQPFFSPDGTRLGFHTSTLMTMTLPDGEPVSLGAAHSDGGASWATDGTIVYSDGRDLFRIPENGGTPVALTGFEARHDADERAIRPHVLPTGDILFTLRTHSGTSTRISVLARDGSIRSVVESATSAKYLPQGYLVYVAGDPPWITVAPFDLDRLEVSGPAAQVEALQSRTHWFDVSPSGTLAYSIPEQPSPADAPRVVWVDRATGRQSPIKLPLVPGEFNAYSLRLSPDGRKVAFTRLPHALLETADWDAPGPLYIGDLDTGTLSVPISSAPVHPLAWTRDGTRISYRTPTGAIAIRRVDGTGAEQVLMEPRDSLRCSNGDWSPDGRVLLMGCNGTSGAEGRRDLVMLSFRSAEEVGRAPAEPTFYLPSTPGPGAPKFTDDGRWFALSSGIPGEAGARVFVRAFPGPGPVITISKSRGRFPIVRGSELFFLGENAPQVATIRPGPTFSFDPPRAVFEDFGEFDNLNDGRLVFGASPDGRRLLLLHRGNDRGGDYLTSVTVVLHWVDHVRRLIAASVQNR